MRRGRVTPPNRHYTAARKIKKNRRGVYVTHDARKLRRQRAYREALGKTVEYGKDALWGGLFFVFMVVGVLVVVIGGLVLFG